MRHLNQLQNHISSNDPLIFCRVWLTGERPFYFLNSTLLRIVFLCLSNDHFGEFVLTDYSVSAFSFRFRRQWIRRWATGSKEKWATQCKWSLTHNPLGHLKKKKNLFFSGFKKKKNDGYTRTLYLQIGKNTKWAETFVWCLLLTFKVLYRDHFTQLLPFARDFVAKGQRLVWGQVG